jgi:hypothetical protein
MLLNVIVSFLLLILHLICANTTIGEEMQERDQPPTYSEGFSRKSNEGWVSPEAQLSGRLLSRVLMWFL